MRQDPIEELLDFFDLVHSKLSTPKKRQVAERILRAFQEHHGKISAWEFGNKDNGIVYQIAEDLEVSTVYVYKVLGELIELELIAKTLRGYEISPNFRKRVYRLYKALGDLV